MKGYIIKFQGKQPELRGIEGLVVIGLHDTIIVHVNRLIHDVLADKLNYCAQVDYHTELDGSVRTTVRDDGIVIRYEPIEVDEVEECTGCGYIYGIPLFACSDLPNNVIHAVPQTEGYSLVTGTEIIQYCVRNY